MPTEEPHTPALSQEWIRQQVTALGEWFQNLDLQGVATAPDHFLGDYPGQKWQAIGRALPAQMQGMSVLDVGCNAGFHALECKRRGAARVVGVDVDARYLEQARFAAGVLGLEVEWRQMSIYHLDEIGGPFDLVLFLGLFYHLRYPLYGLDLVVKKVGGQLVFQSMVRGAEPDDAPAADYDFWDHTPFQRPGFPRLHFIERRYAGDPTNWWIPNRAAVEAMLRSAGLRLVAHPEAETWICELAEKPVAPGEFVLDRELAGTL